MSMRITNVVQMHWKNKLSWLTMPWLILLIPVLGINLIIAYFVTEPIYTGGLASIFIFMLILGAMVPGDTLSFALGLGMRRLEYFCGTLLMSIAISALSASGLLLLALAERVFLNGWGVNLHLFNLPYVNDGLPIAQFWIYFSLLLHMFLLGFVVSCLYYRFGKIGMYAFFVASVVLVSGGSFLLNYVHGWGAIANWFVIHSAFDVSLWLFLISLAYTGLAYLLLRRATA